MNVGDGHDGELRHEEEISLAESGARRSRRPYQKPAFRYERVFETMALSCGKVSVTQFQCRQTGGKNS
jgi:hypothetical protein